MNILLLVEILGSLSYLLQNVFLSIRKRSGWAWGMVGAIAYTVVTLQKGSYSYAALEVANLILFIVGFVLWGKVLGVQKQITIWMSILVLAVMVSIFYFNIGSPNYLLEDTMVSLFLAGVVLLVLKKSFGWICYIFGHVVLMVYALVLQTYGIMVLQILSLPFAFLGYRNLRRANLTPAEVYSKSDSKDSTETSLNI